jgi:hypothetical protein
MAKTRKCGEHPTGRLRWRKGVLQQEWQIAYGRWLEPSSPLGVGEYTIEAEKLEWRTVPEAD